MRGWLKAVAGLFVLVVLLGVVFGIGSASGRIHGIASTFDSVVAQIEADENDDGPDTDSNTSEPLSEQDYLAEMATVLNNYIDAHAYFNELIDQVVEDQSLLLDEDWRFQVEIVTISIATNGDTVRNTKPPERFQEIHAEIQDAATHYDSAMEQYTLGIDTLDSAYLQQCSLELIAADEALVEANRLVDELQLQGNDTSPPASEPASIVINNSNLRAGPGTSFDVVGGRYSGDTVFPVATNQAGDWYKLDSGEWIAGWLLDQAPSDLPIAQT